MKSLPNITTEDCYDSRTVYHRKTKLPTSDERKNQQYDQRKWSNEISFLFRTFVSAKNDFLRFSDASSL